MQALGVDWSTQGLESLKGKRVRFRGWQLFDIEHRSQGKNTAPTSPKDWRATVSEIHPITSFKIDLTTRMGWRGPRCLPVR